MLTIHHFLSNFKIPHGRSYNTHFFQVNHGSCQSGMVGFATSIPTRQGIYRSTKDHTTPTRTQEIERESTPLPTQGTAKQRHRQNSWYDKDRCLVTNNLINSVLQSLRGKAWIGDSFFSMVYHSSAKASSTSMVILSAYCPLIARVHVDMVYLMKSHGTSIDQPE